MAKKAAKAKPAPKPKRAPRAKASPAPAVRPPPAPRPPASATYERTKARAAQHANAESKKGRDVGPLPEVVDVERRIACRTSFARFCKTYLADVFELEWSADHLKAIDRIETAVVTGGLFAYAMPRGSGKTSLAEAGCLWALLYGYRQFIVFIGADADAARSRLEAVKVAIESNDLIGEDFPEVCHPVRALEGINNRQAGQLLDGEPTHVSWTADEVVLPTVPGSASSGICLRCVGITGSIRGMKVSRHHDGKAIRPDLAVVDDPQTDESAESPSQSAKRVKTLSGAVLGLAGPGKKISGFMPCTVIAKGDMADQILDRNKHPAWRGERWKLVYKWPTKYDDLWVGQYARVWADGHRAGDGGKAANDFYAARRDEMDAGAEVAWSARFNPDELSAVQHAINLRLRLGDAAFAAEFQNEPLAEEATTEALTADAIASKVNGRPRGEVPDECTRLVAFVDVQKPLLPWVVMAVAPDFTGYVVDYGAWPDQGRPYYARREVKRTAAVVLKTDSTEATIYQGLGRVTDQLLDREWIKEDGTAVRIDRLLIDANWGESTDVVYKFCRESRHAALLVPTHGMYVGATSRPFNEYRRQHGDEIGDHWRRPARGKHPIRRGIFDANHWKTFSHARWAVPLGGPGCLSLFGTEPHDHKLFADHNTAEQPFLVNSRGRTVTEWKLKNMRPDNDWFDGVAGCCVAASMLGVSLAERKAPKAKAAAAVVTFAEAKKTRRVWRPGNHG